MRDRLISKTNILHVIPDLDIGGVEIMILTLLEELDKKKYKTTVAYWLGDKRLADGVEKAGVEAIDLKVKNGSLLRVIFRLVKLIKEKKIKLIHTYLFDADLCGFLAAKWAKVPIIISTVPSFTFFKTKKHRFRYKIMSLFFDKFITVSKALEKYLVKYCRINSSKVTTVYCGVNLNKFNIRVEKEEINKLREDFSLGENDIVIGTVGRLEFRKGHRYLLESAVRVSKVYPKVKFLLVGIGELRNELKDFAKRLDITSKIIFAGFAQDIPSALSLLDIFVLPSLDEGLGIAILEAMACGLPVIATNVGGIPELVKDGETGLLVAPRSSSALASAIIRLLADKEYATTLREAGKKRAKQFSSKIMVEKIEEIYDYYVDLKMSKLEKGRYKFVK